MPGGYGTQADYIEWVRDDANERQGTIEKALRDAFSCFIEKREVEVIVFSSMNAFDLAKSIVNHPQILKPILAACNIAARAIERDLSIKNVNTYEPKLDEHQAGVLAGYIKPFLPPYLEIPTLCQIDRIAFIDKEIRKKKGRWENGIIDSLNRFACLGFKKRTFKSKSEVFELDAANPKSGDVKFGVDVKRIEARRDIHKRCDEIVNKAAKLKLSFPESKFCAVIYYPFIEEHINIQSRLSSANIDYVVFASEAKESIENAVKLLLSSLGVSNLDHS